MNCNRYEYEMSMSLDGRLPSGRREALLTHIDACTTCAGLWDEMRHAQELTLSLPPQHVGSEFQDTLWDRIRAGEGSPEAVFNEPVPIVTKTRYVLTGAAAAALVIFAVNLFGRSDDSVTPAGDFQLAKNDDPISGKSPNPAVDSTGQGGLARLVSKGSSSANHNSGNNLFQAHENTAQPLSRSVRDFTPHNVAEISAQRCASRVDQLQQRIRPLQTNLANYSIRKVNAELRDPITELRNSTALMTWMQRDHIIQLPPEAVVQIQRIEESIQDIQTAETLDDLRMALRSVRKIRTEPLRSKFFVKCCEGPNEFFGKFKAFYKVNPKAGRVLDIQIIAPSVSHTATQILLMVPPGNQSRSVVRIETEFGFQIGNDREKMFIRRFETSEGPQKGR